MKTAIKIICTLLLVVALVILLLLISAANTSFVPNNYTETVETGGMIEAVYLKKGKYEVSYFEADVNEDFKKYEVYYPTELTTNDKQYPVVVFVNGTGVVGSKYSALFEHLASWGFIVIGNEEKESWDGRASDKSVQFLIEQNENKDGLFYQKVDVAHIGISGHSQGGVGVFNAITEQGHSTLYKTAVALSPTHEEQAKTLKWSYDLTKIEIPIMMIAGTKGDFETKLVLPFDKMCTMYDKIESTKVMMRKTGYEHGEILYVADGYVTAWFMWQLQGDDQASNAFLGEQPEFLTNALYQDQKVDVFE